jgi:hypothetical protein
MAARQRTAAAAKREQMRADYPWFADFIDDLERHGGGKVKLLYLKHPDGRIEGRTYEDRIANLPRINRP